MHYLILAILAGLLAWATHTWVDARALAVAVGDKWVIDGQGWSSMWPIIMAGLIPGLVLGLFTGRGFGQLIEKWIDDGMEATRAALAQERQQIEAKKSNLDAQIRKSASAARQQADETIQKAEISVLEARKHASMQERRVEKLEGRLKGAQQRAKRKEKALLTSRNAAKPEAV